jgi:hypothetical protein
MLMSKIEVLPPPEPDASNLSRSGMAGPLAGTVYLIFQEGAK